MNCIVTAGPTYESLDKVRRLTNSSTGCLGIELANSLAARGHDVTLLVGTQASYAGERRARRVETFTTTADLRERLQNLANQSTHAVFHPAAVSDFLFGKIWSRSPQGALSEIKSGKISTRQGTLLAELVPTPKIIAGLRDWFPKARIVGWKYETDGECRSSGGKADLGVSHGRLRRQRSGLWRRVRNRPRQREMQPHAGFSRLV